MIGLLDALLCRFGRVTVGSMAADFGPPPGAVYAREFAGYSDEYLTLAERDEVIARAQADAAARRARRKADAR